MATVTFQVLEGVDKGRVYRNLITPVTVGREEGNVLRLNDERVSRYHAKIQAEDNDIIVTDLESTNGTRVNGSTIQIRRLHPGDQLSIGRTMLLFGTDEEIDTRRNDNRNEPATHGAQTIKAHELAAASKSLLSPAPKEEVANHLQPEVQADWSIKNKNRPPLPNKLTGSQAARLAEILDFMHEILSKAVSDVSANEDGTEVRLSFDEWQAVLGTQAMLAQYGRSIAEPDDY